MATLDALKVGHVGNWADDEEDEGELLAVLNASRPGRVCLCGVPVDAISRAPPASNTGPPARPPEAAPSSSAAASGAASGRPAPLASAPSREEGRPSEGARFGAFAGVVQHIPNSWARSDVGNLFHGLLVSCSDAAGGPALAPLAGPHDTQSPSVTSSHSLLLALCTRSSTRTPSRWTPAPAPCAPTSSTSRRNATSWRRCRSRRCAHAQRSASCVAAGVGGPMRRHCVRSLARTTMRRWCRCGTGASSPSRP